MTDVTTSDTGIPPGYPPADHERDRLGMFGGDAIWRYLFPLLKPMLTTAEFAEFRGHVGAILSILGEAIFLADDSGPATLMGTLEIADNERARSSAAFAKYLDRLAEAKSEIDDAAPGLYSAFALVENGLEDLANDLVQEAKDAGPAGEDHGFNDKD